MSTFIHTNHAATFARDALGFLPDVQQARLLETRNRFVILNCHRQWGKTTVTAVRAVYQAVQQEKQLIVIVSPTMRQSRALASRCREFASRLGLPLRTDGTTAGSIVFPNGSTILPLPAHPDKLRGFTANLLVIDEAARVRDEVYSAATPMLATTRGDLWLLSTPKGRSGFFYEEWMAKDTAQHPWLRISGPVSESKGRMDEGFLATERRRKTAEQFAEEYDCSFLTAGRNVFQEEWLERSFTPDVPIFDENSREDLRLARHRPIYYLAVDVGKLRDHAALVLMEYRVIPTGRRDAATYQPLYRCELRVVYIERFRLQTSYRELVARVSRLCQHPHLAGHTQLLVDSTGQGLPVVEMFRDARLPVSLLPVTITGGKKVVVSGSSRSVPKADLVASLEVLFERGFLKIASSLPQADLLREELRQFERWSERGGALKYGAGSGHDDLVMALALAGWWAWSNRRRSLTGAEARVLD